MSTLGINDFGLVNVITSVVALSSFIAGSLGMITQRYVSFAIGKGDAADLKRYHDACLALGVFCAIFIVLTLQTLGVWFVATQLVVAPEKMSSVQFIYQFLILSFVAGIFSSFHSWVIFAHEDMHVFALFTIFGAILRLGAAVLIGEFDSGALKVYGLLLASANIIVMVTQWYYCIRHYSECKLTWIQLDIKTIREMLGFVGWTLFGQFTTVCRTQAITILINQWFNPATVAARALSFTIYTQALTFSQNFSSALNPPIIKAYAAGDEKQTFSLIFFGSKLSFFLSWMVTLPLIALVPGVLNLWLGTYPEETILFTRLALIEGAIISVSFPLMTAVRAVGQMRTYELLLGGLQIVVLLLSWLLVRSGYPAYSIFIVAICINLVMFVVRLVLASNLTGLSIKEFVRIVICPVVLVVGVSSGFTWGILEIVPEVGVLEFKFVSLIAVVSILLLPGLMVFALGLSSKERRAISRMIQRRFSNSKVSS